MQGLTKPFDLIAIPGTRWIGRFNGKEDMVEQFFGQIIWARHADQHSRHGAGRLSSYWASLRADGRRSAGWLIALIILPCGLWWPAVRCEGFAPKEYIAEVVKVLDGDTFTVLHGGQEEEIRLEGIDCPEKAQYYGEDSTKFTKSRVLHKVVMIQPKDVDRDGRIVAVIVLADGTSLNRELVKEGLGWWFFRYSNDETLKQLEREARDAKRGVWRDPIPLPPWVFRKIQRKQVPELTDFEYPGRRPSRVLANKRGVYREPSCKRYAAMEKQKGLVTFDTIQEAEEAGYHKASDCPRGSAQE